MGPSSTQGAVTAPTRRAVTNVVAFQCPHGAEDRGEEAFPARATTIAACHVRAGARFVDEDEAFRVADVEALSSQMGDPMTSRRFIQFGS